MLFCAASAVLLAANVAAAAEGPVFEVASIKPWQPARNVPFGCKGGPGTSTPNRFACTRITLSSLVLESGEDLWFYQLETLPHWMSEDYFVVNAIVPGGATPKDLRRMVRNLLGERFKLEMHFESREAKVYDLSVDRLGPKLHESAPGTPPSEARYSVVPGTKIGAEKFPEFPPGASGLMSMNNRNRWRSSNVTMQDIVWVCRFNMKTDVIDKTGLNGRYDVDVHWQSPHSIYRRIRLRLSGPRSRRCSRSISA